MFNVYFDNGKNTRLIGKSQDDDGCMKIIDDFCIEKDYGIPYIRMFKCGDGSTTVDVGSHTQFFKIEEVV